MKKIIPVIVALMLTINATAQRTITFLSSDGVTIISDSKDVAVFSISTVLSEVGLNDVIADTIAADAVSPIIPYQWEFNDGKKYTFNIKNYVKR